MHTKTWRIVGLMGLMLLAACGGGGSGKDPDDTPDGGGGPNNGGEHRPGLGNSTKPPEGQPFSLPSGLEVAGTIKGYSVFEEDKCFPHEEPKGAGDMVRVCLPLRNTTNTGSNPVPITLVIPAGFTVVSNDLSTQNGIIIQRQTVTVQPGTTINVPLYLFCLNGNRDVSSTADTFVLGPVIQYPDFLELFELLKDKTFAREGQGGLQQAVWRLSRGEALSSADREAISKL